MHRPSIAAGGEATCAIRVRFAPSAEGARAATLRIRYASGGAGGGATASYDVPLTGTGLAESTTTTLDDDDPHTTTTAATTTATTVATPVAAPAAAKKTPTLPPQAKKKSTKLILTLSHRKLAARAGRPVAVGFALGRAAHLVVRVKRGARTVEILRAAEREGRGSLKWDGRLGRTAAPTGTYRLDVYAVAADGRAARGSITLTVK